MLENFHCANFIRDNNKGQGLKKLLLNAKVCHQVK